MRMLPPELVRELKSVVGEEWVVTEKDAILKYLFDETAPPVRPNPSGK